LNPGHGGLAEVVFFHGHAPVVPHEIHLTGLHLPLGEVPATRAMDIGFGNGTALDPKGSVSKRHALASDGNDALEVDPAVARQPHGHDITLGGLGKPVLRLPDEVEPAVSITGFHALAPDYKGRADEPKEKVGGRGHDQDAK